MHMSSCEDWSISWLSSLLFWLFLADNSQLAIEIFTKCMSKWTGMKIILCSTLRTSWCQQSHMWFCIQNHAHFISACGPQAFSSLSATFQACRLSTFYIKETQVLTSLELSEKTGAFWKQRHKRQQWFGRKTEIYWICQTLDSPNVCAFLCRRRKKKESVVHLSWM